MTALGKHTASIDGNEVRKLAKKFVAADFYSMDAEYIACVTDVSVYILSIEIDGHKKEVKDRRGRWVGMPSVISQLEDDVDTLAQTSRWIGTTLEGYLRELGRCLMSQAVEAKVKSMDASDDPFLAGKLIAYHEVLLIMLNRAGFFGIESTSLLIRGFRSRRGTLIDKCSPRSERVTAYSDLGNFWFHYRVGDKPEVSRVYVLKWG